MPHLQTWLHHAQRTPTPAELHVTDLIEVRESGWRIRNIPYERRTQAVKLAAVETTPEVIAILPPSERNEALCLAAVQRIGWLIRNLTPAERTQAVLVAAVRRESTSLFFLPPEEQTFELRLMALKQIAGFPPDTNHTAEQIIWAALRKTGYALQFLRPEERTRDLRQVALQQCPKAIAHISAQEAAADPPFARWIQENWIQRLMLHKAFDDRSAAVRWSQDLVAAMAGQEAPPGPCPVDHAGAAAIAPPPAPAHPPQPPTRARPRA